MRSAFLLLILCSLTSCLTNSTDKYLANLESENVVAQNEAIFYLGELEEERAVAPLIQLLSDNNPAQIRVSAAEALGKIGKSDGVGALTNLLHDPNSNIRLASVEALGKIGDPAAVKPLIEALNSPGLRLTAIWALGNIADESSVPALTALLNSGDSYVRYNAAQALMKIGRQE